GLMRVDLPARTSGELVISLGSTPIRTAAWIISWDILGIALIVTWGRFRRYGDRFEDLEQMTFEESRLLPLLLASLAIITFFLNYPSFPISLRLPSGYELQNSTLTQSRTDTGLSLLSFRLDDNQYQPGDTVHLKLYWQAQRFLFQNYQVQLHLINN